MGRTDDKWVVDQGDCLWNIAKAVYNNPYKWTEIQSANGITNIYALYRGQVLVLPGITAGVPGGGAATPAPTPPSKQVDVKWWALDADTDRQMFCAWEYTREHTAGYNIEVWYDTGQGGWRLQTRSTTTDKQYQVSAPNDAIKVQLKIKPYSETYQSGNDTVYYWTDGEWVTKDYDFRYNPPGKLDAPDVEYLNGVLTCSYDNLDPTILKGTDVEFVIYKDNVTKYKTGIGTINSETHHVSFSCELEPGGSYTVRCRALRTVSDNDYERSIYGSETTVYGGWSEYTSAVKTVPIAPDEIIYLKSNKHMEQGDPVYQIIAEWTNVASAVNYEIQYTLNPEYFDTSGEVQTITTEEYQGSKYTITGLELGHEYYFRICSLNEAGRSGWTPIKSVTLGSRPSAPTTWTVTNNCVIGESIHLYWTHNSTDGSIESSARLAFEIIDPTDPEHPLIKTIMIENQRSEEDESNISFYTLDTTDQEWAFMTQGYTLKWKVQTTGVISEFSEYSIERELNVYLQPEVTIDVKNQNGFSIDTINEFPFYIHVTSTPYTQTPLSYYIEIVANEAYQTVDDTGRKKLINKNDKVYQKYYDPSMNPWEFVAEMTPGEIDLSSGISYTIYCTVAMNSGLTGINSYNYDVSLFEQYYEVDADVLLRKDTLDASIHPFCNEYYIDEQTGETLTRLAENCTLNVYRREYDGSYTLIASGIENDEDNYVVDPHPALDYARYRITATSTQTGTISYADIKGVKFGIKSVVIQWSEDWVPYDSNGEMNEEPPYVGSMIQIPYNLDVQESTSLNVTTVSYVGRIHPVSYYGDDIEESFTASVDIPKDDTQLLYDLRRLSHYIGDVYVREPSGIGYWAIINVQFSLKHNDVVIPVTFDIKRVEGGI